MSIKLADFLNLSKIPGTLVACLSSVPNVRTSNNGDARKLTILSKEVNHLSAYLVHLFVCEQRVEVEGLQEVGMVID